MFVAVVNCIVGSVGYGDQILRIKNVHVTVHYVFRSDGIHVMNKNPGVDLKAGHGQITTVVTSYDSITSQTPFSRGIELLVEVAFESECGFAYYTFET
jgi:hypothetical protein